MRKFIGVSATLLAGFTLLGATNPALGWSSSASQTALVQLTIPPQISLGTMDTTRMAFETDSREPSAVQRVDGAHLYQTQNSLEAGVDFAVSVNSDRLALACGATDLMSQEHNRESISRQKSTGCEILLDHATPVAGGNASDFVETDRAGELTFEKTRYVHFRTNQGGRTGMARLHVSWELNDADANKNQYSGYVKLYAMMPLQES